jgi:gamma-glutamylcyclotransferase (GGCT)/AIG2-like uncharacterized protein YtfP
MRAVTGRSFPCEPAVLVGYARFLLRDRDYPGVIETKGAHTTGMLHRGIDAASWRRLDSFEDDFYLRTTVEVVLASGRRASAWCYVIPRERAHVLSARPWSKPEFERGLASFLSRLSAATPRAH